MPTNKLPRWATLTGMLFGISLLFIGIRFLLAPEVAERGYGLVYTQPNNAFHVIKGIRDVFSGLLMIGFTLAGWRSPLALAVLAGSLIPFTDMVIVWTTPQSVVGATWIHGITLVALWGFGFFLLRSSSTTKPTQS